MFKQAVSFILDKKVLRKCCSKEILRDLLNKNVGYSRSQHYRAGVKLAVSEVVNNRFSYQQSNFIKNGNPAVMLGGILTFLGLKKKTPEELEEELITQIKMGILMIQREKHDEAEKILHGALRKAQDMNDADGITYIHDVLANLAFETRNFQKAEKLFVSTLQALISKGEPEDSNKVVHISLKMAKIFEATKQYEKAELGYKFCIDSLNNKLDSGDEDTLALWGMSMDWYGKFLLRMNKKNDALVCIKKAYEMCVRLNGKEHEQTVVLLNDLGTVSSLVGDLESAMSYLKEAKEIGEKLPEMKDLESIYVNLGQLYLLREMYKESFSACEEGLKKAEAAENKIAFSEAKQCLEEVNKVFKVSEVPGQLRKMGVMVG